MKTALLIPLALLAAAPAERDLATRYSPEKAVRVVTDTTFHMETTAMEMLRDGEPIGRRGGFGGGGSTEKRRSVWIDRWMECPEGRPARMQRSFETVEGEIERDMRGESVSSSIDSPYSGITLEIVRDEDGYVSVEVVDGSTPDDEGLEALRPGLCLDALLPDGPVEEDDSWELEPEAIAHALGLDVSTALYPRPQPDGGEGRGGRGGFRGGFGGGSTDQLLASAEWTGKATLLEGLSEQNGLSCAVVEIELEAERDLDDEGTTGSFTAELEGKLYIAVDEQRPLLLELEGPISTETDMERERQGSVIEIHREAEGTFTYRVSVGEAAFEAE